MQGQILKGVGSFYTVLGEDGESYICRARGLFRKQGVTPVPGDRVKFTPGSGDEDGYLLEILPQKNRLVRPAAANLDSLVIVLSASSPKPDLYLADKLLLQCHMLGISPVIAVNKVDTDNEDVCDEIFRQYEAAGAALVRVSAHTQEGLEELKTLLSGRISCFSGQSAVGKSSLLNALIPELNLEVGELSRKTDRGKHTTRHAELWLAFGGAVLDTPGFSLLEPAALEPSELSRYYPEMLPYIHQCRFPECVHISEPNCAVKQAVTSGEINAQRYERYLQLTEELIELKKHKYD